MDVIKEPRKNIDLLWKHPKPMNTVYRPMKYLLKEQTEDGCLLYNVITSEMVFLDNEEIQLFEGLPAHYNEKMDELISKHFVVTESFDEYRFVNELKALLKKLEPSRRIYGFTILPTTECNARCYYCFESKYNMCTMSESTASDVVKYIEKMCKSEPVELEWFGGEPLVASKRISQICSGLSRKSINYRSTMVSNAYLFDKNLIQTAKKEWNLISVQITLDGTEDVYNETKAYVYHKGSPYQRVLKNIEDLLASGIAVNIRLNVTDKNADNLNSLIDELVERIGVNKGLTCYSHAVYEGVGFVPLSYNDRIRQLIETKTIALDERLRKIGLLGSYSRLPALRTLHCMSDNDSCRLIYPDGTIGKCENRPPLENIGDIHNDITNEIMHQRYKNTTVFDDCHECCLYPDCVNLEICPETGQCSYRKVEWKKKIYATLMKKKYKEYLNELPQSYNKDTKVECVS